MSSLKINNAIIEELETLASQEIDIDDLEGISPLLTGQDTNPALEGMSSAQVLKGLNKQQPSNSQNTLHVYTNSMYRPDHESPSLPQPASVPRACRPLSCHDSTQGENLSRIIQTELDPLSEEVLREVDLFSSLDPKNPKCLSQSYKLLVRTAANDWQFIKDKLSEAAQANYLALLYTITGMTAVYNLQHAKALNSNVIQLGQVVDQLKITTRTTLRQAEMDKEFKEDLTRQLNSFTRGIAEFSEKMELRTLELSQPTSKATKTAITPPTADSHSSHQLPMRGKLEAIPNSFFKSEMLIINFSANCDISLIPTIAMHRSLAELGSLEISRATLIRLLNQDLAGLSNALRQNPSLITQFNSARDKDTKIKILKTAFGSIPDKPDQWVCTTTTSM